MKYSSMLTNIFCLLLLVFVQVSNAYSSDDVSKFGTSGSCSGCDLSSVYNLGSSANPPYDLSFANVTDTRFWLRNATGSNFSSVKASRAIFISAGSFSHSNFEGASLINANFSNQNLSYANFTGAVVTSVNFYNANLYGSQGINLEVVASVCGAILPDGSMGKCK